MYTAVRPPDLDAFLDTVRPVDPPSAGRRQAHQHGHGHQERPGEGELGPDAHAQRRGRAPVVGSRPRAARSRRGWTTIRL